MAEALDTWRFQNAGITPAKLVGPTLASAATIAPTHGIHHVSGIAAIATITPPAADFVGSIVLISDAIWTWTAAGNIAIAGTTTAAGKAFRFTYDPSTAKWYPDKIA